MCYRISQGPLIKLCLGARYMQILFRCYHTILQILFRFIQGSKGIIQWPINLFTTPMMIHKNTSSELHLLNHPIKINKSPQSCLANESENIIIKLWGLNS